MFQDGFVGSLKWFRRHRRSLFRYERPESLRPTAQRLEQDTGPAKPTRRTLPACFPMEKGPAMGRAFFIYFCCWLFAWA
jgi:hypothetical protein